MEAVKVLNPSLKGFYLKLLGPTQSNDVCVHIIILTSVSRNITTCYANILLTKVTAEMGNQLMLTSTPETLIVIPH